MKYEIWNIYHVIVHFLPKKHCFWPKKALFFKFTKVLGIGKTPPPCWEKFPNNIVFFIWQRTLKDNAPKTQDSIWPLNLIAVKLPVFSSTMGQNSPTHFFYDSNQWTKQHILDQDRLQCSWRTGKQCIACGGNILSDYLGCCSEIKLSAQVKEGHIKTARVLLTESRWPEGIHF